MEQTRLVTFTGLACLQMVTLEQAVNDMQGHVVMVANSGATAMQPLEHELEDVKAAVAELSTRVDAAVTTAAADKERGDAFAHDIKKLQARASEARHMLRATEDAVREVASFVAELDERIPEGGPVAGAGGEVAAEVARLSAIVAAHKKVLERLEFAVKAQEAAGGGSGAAVDAGVEEQLTELRAEVARCAVASAALPPEAAAQLEALQRSVAGLQTRVEALPRRVDAVERSTAEVLQKALEASDTASAALVAARAVGSAQGERGQGAEEGAQGRETQQAVEARLGALQGAVAQLQGKVTELQDEQAAVAARVGAAAGMGRGGEGAENGHAAPSDSIALQQRLGRLEEATTVLSAKHQQLARQLKQQANVSSQPTTPRVRCLYACACCLLRARAILSRCSS
jgi:DNA repair exonuclease SbcCD ATPase subunit